MSSTERNNLEKEVEDAPTPLLDTANEIETSLKNTTQDVSETVTGILTPANIMVVLGFLGIYFGYSFYVSRNRIGVLPMNSTNLQTSLTIDILFFVIIGFVLYALLSSDRFKDQTITSSFLDFITDYLDNPSSVIVSVLILTLLYISIYLFGIPKRNDGRLLYENEATKMSIRRAKVLIQYQLLAQIPNRLMLFVSLHSGRKFAKHLVVKVADNLVDIFVEHSAETLVAHLVAILAINCSPIFVNFGRQHQRQLQVESQSNYICVCLLVG